MQFYIFEGKDYFPYMAHSSSMKITCLVALGRFTNSSCQDYHKVVCNINLNDNITPVFSLRVLHGACEFVGKRYSIPAFSWTMKKMTDLRSEDITYTLSTFHLDSFKWLPILLSDKYGTLHVFSNCLNYFKVLGYYFNCKVLIFCSYQSHDMNSTLIVPIFSDISLL